MRGDDECAASFNQGRKLEQSAASASRLPSAAGALPNTCTLITLRAGPPGPRTPANSCPNLPGLPALRQGPLQTHSTAQADEAKPPGTAQHGTASQPPTAPLSQSATRLPLFISLPQPGVRCLLVVFIKPTTNGLLSYKPNSIVCFIAVNINMSSGAFCSETKTSLRERKADDFMCRVHDTI